jgi:hypothetical protein
VTVADDVVVAAQRGEVFGLGAPTFGPRNAVIDIAINGGHAASRVDTGAIAGLDKATLRCGGSAAGDATIDGQAGFGVDQRPSPFGAVLSFGDLAGDIGNHRPKPGKFAGIAGELGESWQICGEIDSAASGVGAGVSSLDQVQEHVSAELIHGAVFTLAA